MELDSEISHSEISLKYHILEPTRWPRSSCRWQSNVLAYQRSDPFSNFSSLTNTKKLIEPHERFEIATFNLRDHFSTPELVRNAQLSATVLWLGKIYWRMVGCSLKCSKARARNLICCNSLISVLPPLIICNKLYCTLKINLKHVVGSLNSSWFIRNINMKLCAAKA